METYEWGTENQKFHETWKDHWGLKQTRSWRKLAQKLTNGGVDTKYNAQARNNDSAWAQKENTGLKESENMKYSSTPKAVGRKCIAKAGRRARPTSLNNAILSALGSLRESSLLHNENICAKLNSYFKLDTIKISEMH